MGNSVHYPTINYPGGNRRKPALVLSTYPKGGDVQNHVHITKKAIKELGGFGQVGLVTHKGISFGRTGQLRTDVPSIFVREIYADYVRTHKVYVGQSGVSRLAQHFEFEEKLINGAFFIKERGEWSEAGNVQVALSWNELVESAWRKEFLSWIHDPLVNHLPNPPAFSWSTITGGFFTLPGIGQAIKIGDKTDGKLSLTTVRSVFKCFPHVVFFHQGEMFDFKINSEKMHFSLEE